MYHLLLNFNNQRWANRARVLRLIVQNTDFVSYERKQRNKDNPDSVNVLKKIHCVTHYGKCVSCVEIVS